MATTSRLVHHSTTDMPPLRFYTSYRHVLINGRLSGIPLPWLSRERHPIVSKCYNVFISAFLMYKIVCTTYSIISIDVFAVRVYLTSAFFYFISGLGVILFFLLKGEDYVRLVGRIDRLTDRIAQGGLGRTQHFHQRYDSVSEGLNKFLVFMTVSAFICPAMFCVSLPFMDFLAGDYRSRTAVPAQCPMELMVQQIPGVFEFIVIQQSFAYTIPSVQKLVSEMILLAMFKIQKEVFSYLSVTLRMIADEMSLPENKESSSVKLKVWIEVHQEALSVYEEIIILASPLVVMYYLLIIVSVAGSLLYMLDASSSNMIQTMFGAGYMCMTMVSLFLQCKAADEATLEAQNILNDVYNLPWYAMDKEETSFIKLILTMVAKPIYVDAYRSPAFRLSLESYQAFFLNAVSAYMGFKKVLDLQQHSE